MSQRRENDALSAHLLKVSTKSDGLEASVTKFNNLAGEGCVCVGVCVCVCVCVSMRPRVCVCALEWVWVGGCMSDWAYSSLCHCERMAETARAHGRRGVSRSGGTMRSRPSC